jgi:tetratricopeptide (TPR) repeat protein
MSDPRKLPDDLSNADWDKLLDSFDEVAPAPAKAASTPAAPPAPVAVPVAQPTPVDTHQVKTAPPPPILYEALGDPDDDRTRINAVPADLLESVRREAQERADVAAAAVVPKAPRVPTIAVPAPPPPAATPAAAAPTPPAPAVRTDDFTSDAPTSIGAAMHHLDFVEEEAVSDLTKPDLTLPEGAESAPPTAKALPIAADAEEAEALSIPPDGPVSSAPAAAAPPLPPRIPGPPRVPAAPPVPKPAAAAPPAPKPAAPPPPRPPLPTAPRAPAAPPLPPRAAPAVLAGAKPEATPVPIVVAPPPPNATEETAPPLPDDFDLLVSEGTPAPAVVASPAPPPVAKAPLPVSTRSSRPPPLPAPPKVELPARPPLPSVRLKSTPPARPLSVAPMPLPPPPDAMFPDEREAYVHLAELDTLDEFRDRAIWLEAEARLTDDAAARARTLLVASELRAMVGDDDQAYALADEVLALAPASSLAHRQARAAQVRRRELPSLVASLDAEVAAVAAPAAKLSSETLAAEITRITLGDDDESLRRSLATAGAHASDPRAHVDALRRALAVPGVTPTAATELPESLAGLGAAFASLAAARGAEGPLSPSAALAQARAALADLEAVKHGEASDALAGLAGVRGVGGGAAWLGYALASARAESRARALPILKTLLDGPDARAASRAIATAALQTGDDEAATAAVGDAGAFSLGERAAFAALTGKAIADADVEALAADDSLVGLASAASALSQNGYREPLVGNDDVRPAIATGRALAVGTKAELEARIDGRDGAIYDLLRVENAASEGRLGDVAAALGSWAHGEANDRDRALVASVLYDLAGQPDLAVREARRIDVAGEVVARILLGAKEPAGLAMLQEVAETTEDAGRRAVLLLETVLRQGDSKDAPDLLQAAHEAAPELPFAAALAARDARLAGDVDALLTWIRLRREGLADPREVAFDNVREAMLVADTDLPHAVSLLEQASRARPEDVALRDLLARLSPEPLADRVEVLERAMVAAPERAKARLALAAAWEQERVGKLEEAAALAARALEAGGGPLARRTRDRLDFFGSGASRLAEELMEAARGTEDAAAERAAFEQLAYLDEVGRGDVASGLLWHRSILEKSPGWLPSLRKLEHALVTEGREEELEPIFAEITRATVGVEAIAHAQVAARLGARNAGWDTTKDLVQTAAAGAEPTVWALRQLIAHARAANDDKATLRAAGLLAERTDRADETAALHLHAGEAAFALGELSRAQELFEKSLREFDGSVVAQLYLAETLRKSGDARAAAEKLEATAALSRVASHQARIRYDAAILWLDQIGDLERGTLALESAGEHDIGFGDIATRLQKLYIDGNERAKLAGLLQRRLDSVQDPEERVALEVLRGRALAEVGDNEGAKSALAAALEERPDHVEALRAFVDVCQQENDWENVEQATIRLARLVIEPTEQAALYLTLGRLYEDHLQNPERAEASYREVLKRDPENLGATERVVGILAGQGDFAGAVEMQTALITAATDPAEKRRRGIALARLHEDVAKDVKKAEQMLEALRKEGPQDSVVLRALAEFHVRHNHGPAVNVLLDRTANDARRALTTGRFDLHFFANLGTVFELRGKDDAAEVATGTVASLEGRPVELTGIGARAARPDLDDLLAPEIFTPAFRELLTKAGDALDAAVAVDLKGIKAVAPSPDAAGVVREAQALGERFGFSNLEVLVSPTLGAVCLPASTSGQTIVYGAAVLDAAPHVRQYLTLRALGILRARVAPFSRTPPIELWPLAAALLKIYVPTWDAPAADAGKVADYKARIERHLPPGLDLGPQAHEVIGSLGNRASTLQAAANSWGARVAFLALGDLSACLAGIATAAGQATQPAASGPERMTWIGRNAEARDLAVFSVNDAYVEARARGRSLGSNEKRRASSPTARRFSFVYAVGPTATCALLLGRRLDQPAFLFRGQRDDLEPIALLFYDLQLRSLRQLGDRCACARGVAERAGLPRDLDLLRLARARLVGRGVAGGLRRLPRWHERDRVEHRQLGLILRHAVERKTSERLLQALQHALDRRAWQRRGFASLGLERLLLEVDVEPDRKLAGEPHRGRALRQAAQWRAQCSVQRRRGFAGLRRLAVGVSAGGDLPLADLDSHLVCRSARRARRLGGTARELGRDCRGGRRLAACRRRRRHPNGGVSIRGRVGPELYVEDLREKDAEPEADHREHGSACPTWVVGDGRGHLEGERGSRHDVVPRRLARCPRRRPILDVEDGSPRLASAALTKLSGFFFFFAASAGAAVDSATGSPACFRSKSRISVKRSSCFGVSAAASCFFIAFSIIETMRKRTAAITMKSTIVPRKAPYFSCAITFSPLSLTISLSGIAAFFQSGFGIAVPMTGMITFSTSPVTILPNAAPMMTPTARSTTLPLNANFLKSSATDMVNLLS